MTAKLNDRFLLLEKADEEIQLDLLGKEASEEEFTEEFNSTIECRDRFGDISFVVEELLNKDEYYNLFYLFIIILIQATVPKSTAHDLVTSFPPTNENYPKVINYLKSRFGNNKILLEVYVREFNYTLKTIHIDRSNNYKSAMVSTSPKINKNNFCHFCKKPGRIKPYCYQFKKFLETQEQNDNENENEKKQNDEDKEQKPKANVAQLNEKDDYGLSIGNLRENELILDSGGTRHAFHGKIFFNTLDESYRNKMKIANGRYVTAFGIGSVKLQLKIETGETRILTLHNVLYIPSLVGNVLSISKLTDHNYKVEFNKSVGKLTYNNMVIGVADKTANGLMRKFRIPK